MSQATELFVEQNKPRLLDELKTFLRIPSVSTLPEHVPDVRRAAQFVADSMRAAGLENIEIIATAKHPLVYADWLHAPGKPTVLCYGHYDVQPPDPLDEWISPPFEPTVRDGNLYARGSADDKGQMYMHIKAVEALLSTTGTLPVNLKFLIEGEEEVGGESVAKFVAAGMVLAAAVWFLFERAPKWTAENIVPLFDWSSPDAHAAWSSLKYSNYIGSPKLIRLMKEPFLALFGRDDVDEDDLQNFAEWLAAIMLAKQAGDADYPITPTEARSALRQAGAKGLSSVGHRLAVEMEKAKPKEKIARWRNIVGPVFQNIWPLDAELQTSSSTFKLVQILRAGLEARAAALCVLLAPRLLRHEHPTSRG